MTAKNETCHGSVCLTARTIRISTDLSKRCSKKNPDTRFILTGGDNTDCGQHEVQWNGAFSGLVGISEHIPFMMTLGNHDNRGFKDYKNRRRQILRRTCGVL